MVPLSQTQFQKFASLSTAVKALSLNMNKSQTQNVISTSS